MNPTISLSSCGEFSGDFSTDVCFQNRLDSDEGILYSMQEDEYQANNESNYLSLDSPLEGTDESNLMISKNPQGNDEERLNFHHFTLNESNHVSAAEPLLRTIHAGGSNDQSLASVEERVKCSQPLEIEKNAQIWLPPEPEDIEDDIECSVADYEDDDELVDVTKWGQNTSFSCPNEEHGSRYRFREQRGKALFEVMNGRFRDFLYKLLRKVGVSISEEAGENWLDIISSLSLQAATIIKPDATEGRAMDPTCYLKVKCVASGSRGQSKVIRGLIFKKNAAHKHMPIKYKNPRLLLLQGVLGQQVGGLSSFDSMENEKDYLRSTIEMINTCHPNVVLVEKTVSRDLQESLLSKGITLVYDMKLPRLERIARCTSSQLVSSSSVLLQQELKQCDSFYIEKFVEEHCSLDEGGKQPKKTLMYFEGCPKPLGCTVLLMGAHNDELKKVKFVVQQAVFLAHHLILETSYLVDQRASISNLCNPGVENRFSTDKQFPAVSDLDLLCSDVSTFKSSSDPFVFSDPISNGFLEKSIEEGSLHYSDLSSEGNMLGQSRNSFHSYNYLKPRSVFDYTSNSEQFQPLETSPILMSKPLSPGQSIRKYFVDSVPLVTSPSSQTLSPHSDLGEKELDMPINGILSDSSPVTLDCKVERNNKMDKERLEVAISGVKNDVSSQCFSRSSEHHDNAIPIENNFLANEGNENESDPLYNYILVLKSSRCISGGNALRKQPHLSRIKYYRDSDMTLGKFLLDNLLNQKNHCSTCGEPPEGHVYSYIHKNGKVMVFVKRLSPQCVLPGEAEGKLWMWSRCLKCVEEGYPKSTTRVVMSCAARHLSLGKFFELGFSNHLASSRIASCGHMLHRDCLQFYGLGSAVAMFGYSSVDIYTACMPPAVLEFNNPIGQEWLHSEAKDVLEKGNLLFMDIMNSLQNMVSKFSNSKETANIVGSAKAIFDLEEILKQEKSDFEAFVQKAVSKNGKLGQTVNQILRLNRLNHELLLELYVWDRRLQALESSSVVNGGCLIKNKIKIQDEVSDRGNEDPDTSKDRMNIIEGSAHSPPLNNELSSDGGHNTCSYGSAEQSLELKMEISTYATENMMHDVTVSQTSIDAENESWQEGKSTKSIDSRDSAMLKRSIEFDVHVSSSGEKTPSSIFRGVDVTSTNQEISTGALGPTSLCNNFLLGQPPEGMKMAISAADINFREMTAAEYTSNQVEESVPSLPMSEHSLPSNLESFEGWVWDSFSETRKAYRRDLQRGFSQKFEFINDYIPTYLSTANQLITQEMSRLHFPVDTDDNVVSIYEDEFSSIIACALAILQDQYSSTDNVSEKDGKKDREPSPENLTGLVSDVVLAFPHWWSSSSSDLEGLNSSFSSEESFTLNSEGIFTSDPLLSSQVLHPEIPLGVGKLPGKSKYSVVCIHGKQFYSLRRRCCPSELDFISSLSRCKKWDPQGGKSGAYFAKTLDDRFIVKQIKKAELDSFLKFAPEYFSYISQSLSSGSQMCLAKILGIYQVIIRQSKSGKEVKIDLIVMENLFFGRNISRVYDLKGVLHRYASNENGTRKVLFDQNFVEDMNTSPFYISGQTKHLLQRAIWNDTSFLTSINVMDYSLLLGVDKQRCEIIFGVIDYLRQYTWDKHLETWVKASLVVQKNELPTVISPKEYKKRFRNFMSTHFLTVPGDCCLERLSVTCRSSFECGNRPQTNTSDYIEKLNEPVSQTPDGHTLHRIV